MADALDRVLRLPSVASKRFLTTKVDRSVGGLVAQQQCVGPLQVRQSLSRGLRGAAVLQQMIGCQGSSADRQPDGIVDSRTLTNCVLTAQLPLADVAVMAKSHQGLTGAATSIGEQPYKVHLPYQIGATTQMSFG